ncbi:MAG TPA: DUF1552 domain-containing protein, partial [Planctomycetaceae bacterium]|nr:DUF1552 domain-containing protein [Planctomycetaceae bacterium]
MTNHLSPIRTDRRLSRRALLRGAGAALALPALECMLPRTTFGQTTTHAPRRMVAINFELSFHPPNLMPEQSGRDYEATPYLKPLGDLRNDFTIISGTSHPDVDGGHAASKSWLTGAPHPGAANFTNTISMDQLAAKAIGLETRFSYLAVGSGGCSVSANGVPVPANTYPSKLFSEMFLEGRQGEKERQVERLREGQSVLDSVLENAKRMQTRVSRQDQDKLDQYFTSVREAEQRLLKAEQWQHKPKPQVDVDPPNDIRDQNDIISRARLLYDIMYLAIQTDSTRVISYGVGDSNAVATLPGINMNYHDLSHHGQDPEKLKQLGIIESAHIKTYGEFLTRLKETKEGDATLLDRTMVLMGSHMHSGGHNNLNLPIILAGGGFQHGQHLAFDQKNNYPLANLYVSMLQRLGLEVDRFA